MSTNSVHGTSFGFKLFFTIKTNIFKDCVSTKKLMYLLLQHLYRFTCPKHFLLLQCFLCFKHVSWGISLIILILLWKFLLSITYDSILVYGDCRQWSTCSYIIKCLQIYWTYEWSSALLFLCIFVWGILGFSSWDP